MPLGEGRGGPEPADRVPVGFGRGQVTAAGEDPYVGGFEVGGEPDQGVDLGEDRLVGTGRGHPGVAGDSEDGDAGGGQRAQAGRTVAGGAVGVQGFLGVGPQFEALVAVRGGEVRIALQRGAGQAEGGEGVLHGRPPPMAAGGPAAGGPAAGGGAVEARTISSAGSVVMPPGAVLCGP